MAHYPVREDAAEPLFPLALPNLARSGTAASFTTEAGQLRAQLIDSGTPATIWHRVFMEASIPPACGVVVWLATIASAAGPVHWGLRQADAPRFVTSDDTLGPAACATITGLLLAAALSRPHLRHP